MMYAYYPGCSLESTSVGYNRSTLAVASKLGIELQELDDWNCCGATSYMSVDENLSFAISSRNLALAEQRGLDIVAACSACYTVLRKVNDQIREYPSVRTKIDTLLSAGDLHYSGRVSVYHLLEIIVRDVGMERIHRLTERPLKGLRIVPYYGCQIVRPVTPFDDPEAPVTLDRLMAAAGAEVVSYPFKTRCCGGSLIGTREDLALRMVRNLLMAAESGRAHCMITTCPMCQINLEAYQEKVNARFGTHFRMPVFYFTQILGYALGCSMTELGLPDMFLPLEPVLEKVGGTHEQ